MSQNVVLVTGATGTVGSEVIQALMQAGVSIRATYNSPNGQAKLKAWGIEETVPLEMGNADSLSAAFQGVRCAFLLVPFTPQIVEQGQALIDAAQQAGVQYVVRLSAFGARPDATTLTGQWHNNLDDYLRASGLPHTILQPNFFMQNFITFYAQMITQQHALYLPYGNGAVSWVDARDIGAVAAMCLQQPQPHIGKTYVLTGPEALTTEAIAQAFSATLGHPITYHDVPEAAATEAMRQQGTPDVLVQALTELNGVAKAGYSSAVSPDVETVLGRSATPFHQFINDYQSVWL